MSTQKDLTVRLSEQERSYIEKLASRDALTLNHIVRQIVRAAMVADTTISTVVEPAFDPYDFAKHSSYAGMKRLTESQQRETIHCFIEANRGTSGNELAMLKQFGLEPITELDTLLAQQEAQINKDYPDAS